MRKKHLLIVIVLILLMTVLMGLVACKPEGKKTPPKSKVTITFDSQGGSAVAPITIEKGTKITMPADPTRETYNFGGWYTDAACSENAWYDASLNVDANLKLFAKWVSNVKLPIDPNDRTCVEKLNSIFDDISGGIES